MNLVIGGTPLSGSTYITHVFNDAADGIVMNEPIMGAAAQYTDDHPFFSDAVSNSVRNAYDQVVEYIGWLPRAERNTYQVSVADAYATVDDAYGLKEVRHAPYVADALSDAQLLYLERDIFAQALSAYTVWSSEWHKHHRAYAKNTMTDIWKFLTDGGTNSFIEIAAWFIIAGKSDIWLIDELNLDALVVSYDNWQDAPTYYLKQIEGFTGMQLPQQLRVRGFGGEPQNTNRRHAARDNMNLKLYRQVQDMKYRAQNVNWLGVFDAHKELVEET